MFTPGGKKKGSERGGRAFVSFPPGQEDIARNQRKLHLPLTIVEPGFPTSEEQQLQDRAQGAGFFFLPLQLLGLLAHDCVLSSPRVMTLRSQPVQGANSLTSPPANLEASKGLLLLKLMDKKPV